MPIYEFDCKRCGESFEELVRSDREQVKCSSCGSLEVTRRFSVFGLPGTGTAAHSARSSSCRTCATRNCSTCH